MIASRRGRIKAAISGKERDATEDVSVRIVAWRDEECEEEIVRPENLIMNHN